MKLFLSLLGAGIILLTFNGCDQEDSPQMQSGQVTFSYRIESVGGRVEGLDIPAFASYTLKKSDGSTSSKKIALYSFNGDFVSLPTQLQIGHYTLEQFLILNSDNQTIYASPVEGSELADLVEHPLPLSVNIVAEEITSVVPEVLAVENYTPEDFGYVVFGFEIVDVFDLGVTATIADDAPHTSLDYALEIIAKDAALGNVKWRKSINMDAAAVIRIPAKYAHYTFRAMKPGYISHVQHFLKEDLIQFDQLAFEFLPESLDDFLVQEREGGLIKFYTSKDRCKIYARLDMPEGYRLVYVWVDRTASAPNAYPLAPMMFREYGTAEAPPLYKNNVNLFDNTPLNEAQDHCELVDLSLSVTVDSMDDVIFQSYSYLTCYKPGETTDTFINFISWWHEGNSGF